MPETRSHSATTAASSAHASRRSAGYKSEITLKDERRPQAIKLKPARVEWIRLTIIEVYPGAGQGRGHLPSTSRQGSTGSRADPSGPAR